MASTGFLGAVAARIERIEHDVLPPALPGIRPRPATLAERMERFGVPGLSVAVIKDDDIEWARGYGLCELGRPEPVTPDTLFQAGSISKPVAAVAALRLVEQGRLDLDEDANRYLTSWQVPANGDWQPRVTLRHLLCHGGGTTVHGFPGYPRGGPLPTLVQVLNGEPPANTPTVRVDTLPGALPRLGGALRWRPAADGGAAGSAHVPRPRAAVRRQQLPAAPELAAPGNGAAAPMTSSDWSPAIIHNQPCATRKEPAISVTPRGGRRPGAGRPHEYREPLRRVTVTLPASYVAQLRAYGGDNLSEGLRRLVEEACTAAGHPWYVLPDWAKEPKATTHPARKAGGRA